MRVCPTIAARGKEAKENPPSVPSDDVPKRSRFYANLSKESKPDEDNIGKLWFLPLVVMISF